MVLPVPWMNSPAGELCKHCKNGVGCNIFDTAPEDCKNFRCSYNQINNAPIELRPDKCKIIFEKVDDNIFLGTMHPDYNEAYKTEIMQKELLTFLERGFSVVIHSFTIENPVVYPSKGKTAAEVWSSLRTQTEERYGSPDLYN
jgi:hypothetical protein